MLFREYQKVGDQKSSNLSYSMCFLVFEQFKAPYSIARGHKQQLFLFNSASQLMFSFGVFYKFLNKDQIHYELKAGIWSVGMVQLKLCFGPDSALFAKLSFFFSGYSIGNE